MMVGLKGMHGPLLQGCRHHGFGEVRLALALTSARNAAGMYVTNTVTLINA